jgi:hypothetical protein
VDATVVTLALLAAMNPKLLAFDLLMIENRRAQAMFAAFACGALGMAVTLGILQITVLKVTVIGTQRTLDAGVSLAMGVVLLTLGVLILRGRLRPSRARAGRRPSRMEIWTRRALVEPHPGAAYAVGLLAGIPGASYLTALRSLINGGDPLGAQVLAVVVFNVIQFAVVLVPLVALSRWPEETSRRLRGAHDWLMGHAWLIIACVVVAAGAYLALTGALRLAG